MNRRIVYFLGGLAALFVIAGIVSMAVTWNNVKKWQPVNAKVVSNEVVRFQTRRGIMHRGEIELLYYLKDLQYRIPVSLPDSFPTFEGARDDMRRYAIGTTQIILYNSEDPNDILFNIDPARFLILPAVTMGGGVVLLVICIFLFLGMAKKVCPRCASTVTRQHAFCYACGFPLPIRVDTFRQVI